MTPTQITNAAQGSWISVEYSTVCPFNVDNTYLLLVAIDHFLLYSGNGQFLRDLKLGASTRPRWSRQNPNMLTYITGRSLMLYDASNDHSTLIHEFTEYVSLDDRGEADVSPDGHRVLCGTRPDGFYEVFVYAVGETWTTYKQLDLFDGLKITAANRAIMSRRDGIWALNPGKQITASNSHAAVARYQGRNVLLWAGGVATDVNKGAVLMIDIDAPAQKTFLLKFDWNQAIHISACDKDFCLVSAYSPDNSRPCELWKVPLDGSAVTLICHTGGMIRTTKPEDYTSQPKASLSRDGSRAVFNVDDGKTVNAWMVKLDSSPSPAPPPSEWTKVDYSKFTDREFSMRPRADGNLEMWERKL